LLTLPLNILSGLPSSVLLLLNLIGIPENNLKIFFFLAGAALGGQLRINSAEHAVDAATQGINHGHHYCSNTTHQQGVFYGAGPFLMAN
jgi:hypothetical protein